MAYIWHAVIINFLLIIGFYEVYNVILLTFFMAIISWVFVERPVLKMKSSSLRDGENNN